MPMRRRTEEDPEDSVEAGPPILYETGLTRSTEIWLEDGNIVLQAEKTLFKVYRGLLSRHSPIFANVFSIAKPDSEPTVEGCPVMQLHGDSVDDVRHMLLELHDKCYDIKEPLAVDIVGAMVRMGRKYEIPRLEKEGLRRLKAEYPTTLVEMQGLEDWSEIKSEVDVIVRSANLIHEFDVRQALPLAYYWASVMSMDYIVDGIHNGVSGTVHRLLPAVQRICLLGRQQVMKANLDAFEWMQSIPLENCRDPPLCSSIMRKLSRHLLGIHCSVDISPRVGVKTWDDLWQDAAEENSRCDVTILCKVCLPSARASFQAAQEKLWDDLPSFFDLPGWDVLRRSDDSGNASS